MKKIATFALLLFSTIANSAQAPWVGVNLKGLPCTGKGQGYGPFDYIKAEERSEMPIGESYHFKADIENLTNKDPSGDLDYTLRAIPNHHRALLSAIRYQLKLNNKLIKGALVSPAECYLQRAIHFSPKDSASIAFTPII